jgi:PPM family protein phosphatase
MTAGRTWRSTGLTHVGLVRTANQDAFGQWDEAGLWVIADGMGGHAGGDVASRIAVETIGRLMTEPASQAGADRAETLRSALLSGNRAIREEAARKPELADMGTTAVAVAIAHDSPSLAIIAHVGDSRAYLCRDGALTPLTLDHSWVEDRLRQGLLSPEEAARHPLRHMLTRALGTSPKVEVDVTLKELQAGDRLLLCTDGLTKMLDDEAILRLLQEHPGDKACGALVAEALAKGGLDNVTVVLVEPAETGGRT